MKRCKFSLALIINNRLNLDLAKIIKSLNFEKIVNRKEKIK